MLSMVGTSAFVLSVLYARSYPLLLVSVAMVSLVGQIYRPASSALIAELTPQHRRVMIFAVHRLALNLGATVSPLIGALLLSFSYDLLFWVQALTVLCFAAIAFTMLPPHVARGPDAAASAALPAASGYRVVFADRAFVLFLFAFFINSVVYLQYISVLPLAMTSAGLGPGWYSAMIALNGFVVISCELLGTKVMQRWPMRVAGTVGFAVLAAGLAVYAVPAGAGAFVVGTLIWSLAEIIAGPTMSAFPAATAPDGVRGRYIGTAQAVFGIGVAVGPVVGVFAWNVVGRGVWFYYGLLCAVGFAAAWFSMARKGTKPAAPARPATSLAWTIVATGLRRLRPPRRPAPPALAVTVAFAGDSWDVTLRRPGEPVLHRTLTAADAVSAVTALEVPELHAAMEQFLAQRRAQARAEVDRLRAELHDMEAREAEIGEREAQLNRARAAPPLPTVDDDLRLPPSENGVHPARPDPDRAQAPT
jgi:MFS family permease